MCFSKGSGAADLQGASLKASDVVSLDSKTTFLVRFFLFHSWLLATFHIFLLPMGPLCASPQQAKNEGKGSGG